MKIITLLPIRNEGWILKTTLANISAFSDHIIIADQNSDDGSREIYKQFNKVEVIENKNTKHDNSVRWQLFDYTRKKFGTKNLIICIDADEVISPSAIEAIKKNISNVSISFSFQWIQLWGSKEYHRTDGVWKNNWKDVAFYDDGLVNYERNIVLNDHTGRIPLCSKSIKVEEYPLIHYQYINLQQSQIKQVWYKCSELISKNKPRRINYKYSFAKNDSNIELQPVKKEWTIDFKNISINYIKYKDWRYLEIISWFNKYGAGFFESLDIWYINEFKERFFKETGRNPHPRRYPAWLIKLNNIKNKLLH